MFIGQHPDFDPLFPDAVEAEKLHDGFVWTEGPVYLPERGVFLFSDVQTNTTWTVSDDGELAEEMKPSHHQNGHTLDHAGLLIGCFHGHRCVKRQEADGSWTMLAESFEGKRLNSPNDVVVHPDGSIWFTDPTYGIQKPEEGYGGEQELEGQFVFRIAPDGTLTAPIRDRVMPNGLAFADHSTLLVSDTDGAFGGIHRYVIDLDGNALGGEEIARVPGVVDGFRIDEDGRLWCSGGQGVYVLSPDGNEIGHILMGGVTSNVCFGGPDGTLLFVTQDDAVWWVPTVTRQLDLR